MAEKKSSAQRDNAAVETADVPDQVVVQVGKAVAEIMKLRQNFEEEIAAARTEEAAQNLANEVETAAVRAISDQGLTVDQYNTVISAAEEDSDLGERVLTACRAA
jgi:D-alanyl-D-alanine dipeptidase